MHPAGMALLGKSVLPAGPRPVLPFPRCLSRHTGSGCPASHTEQRRTARRDPIHCAGLHLHSWWHKGEFRTTRGEDSAPGTADQDHNPVRVAPRTLIDLSVSEDRLLKVENISTGIQFSVMNVTNRVALYNFLSTFSGTHLVPRRTFENEAC